MSQPPFHNSTQDERHHLRDLIEASATHRGHLSAQERATGRGVLGHDQNGVDTYLRDANGRYLGTAGNLMGDILVGCRDRADDEHLTLAVGTYVGAYVSEAIRIRRREVATRHAVARATDPTSIWPESDDDERAANAAMTAELTTVALDALALEARSAGWEGCTAADLGSRL